MLAHILGWPADVESTVQDSNEQTRRDYRKDWLSSKLCSVWKLWGKVSCNWQNINNKEMYLYICTHVYILPTLSSICLISQHLFLETQLWHSCMPNVPVTSLPTKPNNILEESSLNWSKHKCGLLVYRKCKNMREKGRHNSQEGWSPAKLYHQSPVNTFAEVWYMVLMVIIYSWIELYWICQG